ncbi:hypothetical protein [Alteromonas antoniana]|uniref:hypothetical protein n=1 Tax=Alteromonas antoniana TaxID=2803813 RepID=UPI001C455554|nr:hypothetical protein [Alteromonas antoniana]
MGFHKAFMQFAASVSRKAISNYIDLEMPIDKYTFVTAHGALVTIFKVDGMLNMPIEDSAGGGFLEIQRLLKLLLKDPAHKVSWSYSRDKGKVDAEIESLMHRDRQTAKKLGLSCEDVFDEILKVNRQDGSFHESYFALYTNHKSESKAVLDEDFDLRSDLYEDLGVNLGGASNPFTLLPCIINKHLNKIDEVEGRFSQAKIKITKMECRASAKAIAQMIDPVANGKHFSINMPYDSCNYKSANWHKTYLATKPYAGAIGDTLNNYTPEALSKQLGSQPTHEVEDGILRVGTTYLSPITVCSFPRQDVVFSSLLTEIDPDIPFRVNFILGHSRNAWYDAKRVLAAITRWGHPDNKAFGDAVKERSTREGNSELYCSLQIVFLTWGKSLKEVIRNREKLLSSVQKWEGCFAKADLGDPYETFAATIPGLKFDSPSTVGFPPISSAAMMLPVTSEGRNWQSGSLLFRTHSSQVVCPFEPIADNQDYHLDVLLARPRQGKGVLSNAINFALLVKKGNTQLPYETFVDVGPTSTGYGKFIQDSLPPHMRHLVEMTKLKMGGDYINPADIQFGLNVPLPEEKGFLANFLLMICTDPSSKSVPSNLSGMVMAVIDETYRSKFDYRTANSYVPRVDPIIDEAVERLIASGADIEIDEYTKYFELRDRLFDIGELQASKRCHTLAMPLLGDFRETSANSDVINRDYGEIPAVGSMLLPDYFALKIKEAINRYSMFHRPSSRDFDSARIKIVDVKPMVDTSNDEGIVQTGIFMLLARFIGCKDFVLNEDHIPRFDKRYRAYQEKRILSIRATPKRVTFDELHTTNGCKPFRDQLNFDVKEGPKWNTSICVISHEPRDFGPLLQQATNLFVLGDLPSKYVKELDDIIGLSSESKFVFRQRLIYGPRKGGSSFLHRAVLKDGTVEQVFRFPKGPKELWSYTTEKRDMPLRDRLTSKLGDVDARNLLSTIFPDGTAAKWFLAQEKKDESFKNLNEDEADETLLDILERQLLDRMTSDLLKVKKN